MIQPKRAPVRPRVLSPETGEALPLEDEIEPYLRSRPGCAIGILGTAGAGKTTALEHLAAVLPLQASVVFLDDADTCWAPFFRHSYPEIYTTHSERAAQPDAVLLHLAPWGEDELVEYLFAVHPKRCAAILTRLRSTGTWNWLGGIPEVDRIALDELAADDLIRDARSALWRYLDRELTDAGRQRAQAACLESILNRKPRAPSTRAGPRVLRHRPVQVLLAARQVEAALRWGSEGTFPAAPLPRELVREIAVLVRGDTEVLRRLRRQLRETYAQPMAASILCATQTGWKPESGLDWHLAGAFLEQAAWPRVELPHADLRQADLHHADLGRAKLDDANLEKSNLQGASLRGASLNRCQAHEANLAGADLTAARGENIHFQGANLRGANLERAALSNASFHQADLTATRLVRADLARSSFTGAKLKEADFRDANLGEAVLFACRLGEADFRGARFTGAILVGADLEYLRLPAADFEGAALNSALLTGSVMPRAHFRKADLRGAGLAEVEWERADLREADLRGASFHLGSTRSGLVFSPLACEGSRTGFYTDDYDERYFKSPEEIRKANLCGTDLRGADLEGVNFYLVDLRGAHYDPDQKDILQRTGAILTRRR